MDVGQGRLMQERLEVTIRGVVQGVGFRYFVLQQARAASITGWVANGPASEVRCVAEGAREDLEALVRAIERGPAGALVAAVHVAWMPATGTFPDFSIRSGGHPGD